MRNTVKKAVVAIVAAAMTTPVYAQLSPNVVGEGAKLKTDVEVKQEREREAGYKSGLGKIPDSKGKVDPWGGVRSAAPAPGQNPSRSNSK